MKLRGATFKTAIAHYCNSPIYVNINFFMIQIYINSSQLYF